MSSKFKSWLLLGVIFVVGVVTGSALTIGLGSHFMHSPGARDMKKHWMEHLTHELNLTADQQAKIQPILADAESKIQALHHDEIERGSQIIKATDDQISALLTPDQQAQLQKMEQDRQKMFSGHMHPWGGPPDGPDDHGQQPPPPQSPPPAPPSSATNSTPPQ